MPCNDDVLRRAQQSSAHVHPKIYLVMETGLQVNVALPVAVRGGQWNPALAGLLDRIDTRLGRMQYMFIVTVDRLIYRSDDPKLLALLRDKELVATQ